MRDKKRIVITGGHLAPALAVIGELKKRGGWEIYYFGRKHAMEGEKAPSAESQIVPQLGVSFVPFNPGRLQRRFTRYTLPSLLRVPLGFFQALISLLRIKPQIILSFGGYVSVPVVVAGWLLRISALTHEQTVVFGLASKINAFFARKIAVSFPQSLAHFPRGKVILTGNPIRKEIFEVKKPSWFSGEARSRSAGPVIQSSSYPIIYITGGSQGSHAINLAVFEILPELLKKYVVIHQTGERDYSYISHITYHISSQLKKRYLIVPYVGPEEIGWVLNKADLIVSRAGANTVSEIAALGKPALFIPIPWSYQDEQTQNAKMLVEAGTAEILPQSKLSGKTLLLAIGKMTTNLDRYQKRAAKSQSLIKLEAAKRLIEEVIRLL